MGEISVTTPSDAPQPPEEGREAPDSSPLAGLRQKVKKARERRKLPLHVPDLDGTVLVFRPIAQAEMNLINKTRSRQVKQNDEHDPDEFEVLVNADLIAATCLGIFEETKGELRSGDATLEEVVEEDGTKVYKIHGSPIIFGDQSLAETLEVETRDKAAHVRKLFVTEGDLVAIGDKVVDFSGWGRAVQEYVRGN